MPSEPDPPEPSGPQSSESRPSRAAAQRLSQYLRSLGPSAAGGRAVSSDELARSVQVSAAQVRRDLAALGHLGQRGVGYDAAGLSLAIRRTLGIDRPWRGVLVGVGNLARALLKSGAFREQGLTVVALFDADAAKVGDRVEGLVVEPVASLPGRVRELRPELAVLTTPSGPAQLIAEQLCAAGVRGVMNFAPVSLRVPAGGAGGHSGPGHPARTARVPGAVATGGGVEKPAAKSRRKSRPKSRRGRTRFGLNASVSLPKMTPTNTR